MTDLEKAMAEFAAKQGVTVCPALTNAKEYKTAKRESWDKQQEEKASKRRYENNERNAENMRYDSEGVYYIGGKL